MTLNRLTQYPFSAEYRYRPSLSGMAVVWTGERRAPRKGEWFLSGAIIEAYAAHDDLTQVYPIARLVVARRRSPSAAKIAACARRPR